MTKILVSEATKKLKGQHIMTIMNMGIKPTATRQGAAFVQTYGLARGLNKF